MRVSRLAIAWAMGGGILCLPPLASADSTIELSPAATAPTPLAPTPLAPVVAPSTPAVAATDPHELKEPEPVIAPLPPAIVVGPATLAFAAWVRYRIRRRGDRI